MRIPFLKAKPTRRERGRLWKEKKRQERIHRYQDHLKQKFWRRFFGYIGLYKKELAVILVLILLAALPEILLPQIARYVLDTVAPRKDYRLLSWVILGGAAVYLFHALFRYFEQRSVVRFSLELITRIRTDLFNYQLKLPLSYFEKYGTGKLLTKLTYSATMIKLLVETFAYVCFRELILIALILVAAAFIDWKLTLIFLGLVPPLVLYIRRLNRYMTEVASQLQTKNGQILKILDRTYNSIRFFKLFGDREKETAHLEKILRQDKHYRVERTMVYAGNTILINLLTSLVTLTALWYGGRQIIRGQLTHGQVMAYVIYLGMLLHPVTEFVRASAFLQAGKVGIYSLFSVYENYEPIPEPAHPVEIQAPQGHLEFNHVWFAYSGKDWVLRDFNLEVKPGQRVLILGPSGSGKTSIFNLLLRFYDSERGSIRFDGNSLRRIGSQGARKLFTVVSQDQLHFEDTVIENLRFGSEESPQETLEDGLALAQELRLDRSLTRREKKFGHKIGAEGLGFSRGELQKVALMRASKKVAPVVLLDEPTASLDHHSERETLRFIDQHFAGKTLLVISHRPLPAFHADWIVVLRKGRVAAQGNHHYLLENSEYYRRWVRLASRRERSATAT